MVAPTDRRSELVAIVQIILEGKAQEAIFAIPKQELIS
jgi:hypothetical protein